MLAGIAGFSSIVMDHSANIYLTNIDCTYSVLESILVLGLQLWKRQSIALQQFMVEKGIRKAISRRYDNC